MVRNAFMIGGAGAVRMIGDDCNHLGIQPANADLVEKMQHRVVKLGDHDDHFRPLGRVEPALLSCQSGQ